MMKRITIILGAVLLLASCEPGTGLLAFFSASSFPAHLGLVERVVDLRDRLKDPLPDDTCYNCNHLHFLDGYVFLATNDSQLLVFSEDLKLQKSFNHDYAYGTLGFSDAGWFYLGNYAYNKADFMESSSTMAVRYGFGFFDGANKYVVNQNMQTLELYVNDVPAQQFFDLILEGSEDWRLSGFAYDDSMTPDSVFFFEKDYSDRDVRALFMDSGIYTGPGMFIEVATKSGVPFPDAEDGRYYYTRYHDESGSHPGFVGVWNGTMRLVNSNGDVISSISGYNTDRLAMAFDPDGRFFYLYDADQRALFRCRTWWSKR
jgi:hypothetical protein